MKRTSTYMGLILAVAIGCLFSWTTRDETISFEPLSEGQVEVVAIAESLEAVKNEELKDVPRVEHKGQEFVDLRGITSSTDATAVGPGKLYRDTFMQTRRRLTQYGFVFGNDLKMPESEWQSMKLLFDDVHTRCNNLGTERAQKLMRVWDEKASFTPIGPFDTQDALRRRAKKQGKIHQIRFIKNKKGEWKPWFGSLNRKQAPELFAYEDTAKTLWMSYLTHFLLTAAEHKGIIR